MGKTVRSTNDCSGTGRIELNTFSNEKSLTLPNRHHVCWNKKIARTMSEHVPNTTRMSIRIKTKVTRLEYSDPK